MATIPPWDRQAHTSPGVDLSRWTENDDLFRFVADTSPTLSWISGPGTFRSYFNDAWLTERGIDVAAAEAEVDRFFDEG